MKSNLPVNKADELFENLAEALIKKNSKIKTGKMMSSPGLKYNDKFFAFLYNDKMCFRLGRDFNLNSAGIKNYELLNPFKTKPPLKDWFVIGVDEQKHWLFLAESSLELLKNKVKAK